MCGICGFVGRRDDDLLARMTAALVHRGPDADGFFTSPEASLGFRRLSIIDLVTGNQPVANEDGSVRVVLNGEMYNYRELREGLEKRGHRFSTQGDAEVIVHLYEEHGEGLLPHLQGMFGIALWDSRQKRLLLARDRLGIKPLYIARRGQELFFASEAKSILANPEFPRRLNRAGIERLLTYLYLPGSDTLTQGIEKLPPGHWLEWKSGAVRVEPYWQVKLDAPRAISEGDAVAQLRRHFEEAVESHLVSDVPVGAFLSGGLDSAGVVAQTVRLGQRPQTFTVGFTGAQDERTMARRLAEQFGTEHRETEIDPAQIVSDLPQIIWHLEEPTPISFLPLYYLSRFAKQHVKVALVGEGADELFAGYRRLVPFATPLGYLPAATQRRIYLRGLHSLGGNGAGTADPLRAALNRKAASPLSALLDFEQRYELPDYQLHRVDRMTMAWGVEARVPYLDHRLVEFVNTLPDDLKIRRLQRKYLLRRALEGLVPQEVLEGSKRGFGAPFRSWFTGSFLEAAREYVNEKTVRERGFLPVEMVERLYRPRPWRWSQRRAGSQLFLLVTLEIYCRVFLDQPEPVPLV